MKVSHLVGDEPGGVPNVGGEKIYGGQDLRVWPDKVSPRSLPFPLWSWRKAMTFQNTKPSKPFADFG